MPPSQPLTAKAVMEWTPTEDQRKNGMRAYASRLMVEGLRYEKSGDAVQAKMRYAKCRAYCAMRQIEYPPFHGKQTPTMKEMGQEAPGTVEVKWQSTPKLISGAVGDSSVAEGEKDGNNIELTERGVAVPSAPEANSGDGGAGKVSPPAMVTGAAPVGNDGAPPSPVLPPKPTIADIAPGSRAATVEAMLNAARAKPAQAAPVVEAGATEARSVAETAPAEPSREALFHPEPVPAPKEGDVLTARVLMGKDGTAKVIRKAQFWGLCVNTRLCMIRFKDGQQELASMWKHRHDYRNNEPLDVVSERGTGATAIFEEVRRPV